MKLVHLLDLVKIESSISVNIKDFVNIHFLVPESKEPSEKIEPFKFPVYRSMLPVYVSKRPFPDPMICPPNFMPPIEFQSPQIQSNYIVFFNPD